MHCGHRISVINFSHRSGLLPAQFFLGRVMQTITAFSLVGLALIMVACGGSSGGPANINYDTLITVNDADAIGTVGDQRMSLAEAIRLANGSLMLASLSELERAQVKGVPGLRSRDKVTFNADGGAIRFPLQIQERPAFAYTPLSPATLMPILEGNNGDTLVGNGVRFTNGPDDAVDTVNTPKFYNGAPLGGLALSVSSSDVTISGITFERFISNLWIQPANSAGLSGVKITDNKFYNGGGIGLTATMSDGNRSALRHIVVTNNELLGPAEFGEQFPSALHTAISVTGGSSASASSSGVVVIEDVNISDNVIKQFTGAVQAQALQAIFNPNSRAQMSEVHIARNKIVMPVNSDPAIYVWGGVAIYTGISDIQVSDVLIKDNIIDADGYPVFITGVETLYGGPPSEHIEINGVKVVGNSIKPVTSCRTGITTIAGFPDTAGAHVTDSSMNDVEVSGNTIKGCEWGAFASPVYNWGAPGTSTRNSMSSVSFRKNQVTEATIGIVVAGGSLVASAPGDASSAVVGNELTGLIIDDNHFSASEAGFTIAGGLAKGDAPGLVSQNIVATRQLDRNTNDLSGEVFKIENNLAIDSPAAVTDNLVD